jgi:hypothetical protein
MKAFLVGTLLAVALAIGSSYVLEDYFSHTAIEAFSAPSARVVEPATSSEVQELPDKPR